MEDDGGDDFATRSFALLNGPLPYRGVNLAGAEFGVNSDGSGAIPGAYGSDYTYPNTTTGYQNVSYYLGKGATTFRIPFRWERLQRSRRAALDSTELGRLTTTVNEITNRGGVAVLDPHNYARYGTDIIDSASDQEDLADFWGKMANAFKSNPKVIFALMNEPYGFPTETWVADANKAIAAIRATGSNQLILVPGMAWTGAHSWNQNWYGTPNATAMLNIVDSGNNYAFEVHQYLDADYSGTAEGCKSSTTGVETVQGFTSWLKANGKRGFLGEVGSGTSTTCQAAVNGLLQHLEANTDVWLGWTWWAGGPWWGNYFTSLEPSGSTDKPQMTWLAPHFSWGSQVTPTCTDGVQNGTETGVDCGGSCSACQTGTCSPATYEAENMTKSTGGATTGGWNIWANGSVSTNHTFVAGTATIKVVAQGTPAQGVWPTMELRIGGAVVGTKVVNASTWTEYTFTYNATAGSKSVAVHFTNDANVPPEDRNLLVDKVNIGCPGTQTASCTDGVKNGTETGVDCGGTCPACVVAPTCTDGVKNGTETGVDCGGSTCPACVVAPTCTDNAKNGTESDVDCGGTCTADCANGKGCTTAADCQSAYCAANVCQTQPTGTEPCSPAVLKSGGQTGNFETTGAVCYKVTSNIAGWGCSNLTGRTVLVNDAPVSCGGALPAKVNGAYYFEVSAGAYPWASIYWW
jgi:endoglucanase